MNLIERQQARSFMQQKKLKEDPLTKQQLKHMKDRVETERQRTAILDAYGSAGYVPPDLRQPQKPPKTDEQLLMEEILKNY